MFSMQMGLLMSALAYLPDTHNKHVQAQEAISTGLFHSPRKLHEIYNTAFTIVCILYYSTRIFNILTLLKMTITVYTDCLCEC